VLVQETPRALELLADLGALAAEEARWLSDTYIFFRRVETRLQIALGLDTNEVPGEREAQRRLALRLGFADTAEGDAGHLFLHELEQVAAATRLRYERILDRRSKVREPDA
jgi:glutamine synthetase adenylyltransferase